jgi:hypothetical protein
MKRRATHGIFAAILAASIGVNSRIGDVVTAGDIAAGKDILPAVIGVARSYDMALEQESRIADVTVLTFRVPGCARPLVIAPLDVSLDRVPLVPQLDGEAYAVRYVYLDRAWTKPDHLALVIKWRIHKVLGIFGLSRYVPSGYVLLIDAPRGCRIIDAVNWRPVWDRNYLASLGASRVRSIP